MLRRQITENMGEIEIWDITWFVLEYSRSYKTEIYLSDGLIKRSEIKIWFVLTE